MTEAHEDTPKKRRTVADVDAQLNEAIDANQALDAQNAELHEENEALRKQLNETDQDIDARIKKAVAELVPASFKGYYGTDEFQAGQDGVRKFDEDNSPIRPERRTMDDPFFKDKVDELKFMEEPVTILISKDGGVSKKDIGFDVSVNRDKRIFLRGHKYTVPRKFVSAMAEMVKTEFDSEDNPDRQDTGNLYLYREMTTGRFPFAVLEDKNPRGMAWLEAKLRQA